MQRLLVITAFVLLVSVARTNATADEGQVGSRRTSDENPELKAELEDIAGIRERLGIDLFKGTVFENSVQDLNSAAQFLEVYRRFAKSRPNVVQASANQVEIQQPNQLDPLSDEVKLFVSLTEAGRQLDSTASNREASGRFDEATQLRKLAKRIRKLLPVLENGIPIREANRRSD